MAKPQVHYACLLPDGSDEPQVSLHPTRVCVVDVGTNSFHTIIVDAHPNGSFEVVDKIKEMVRLGERGLSGQHLTEAAMQRSVRAMRRVRTLAEGWNATEYLAFATSAIREAANGGLLVDRIRKETGIRVRAISGELEAHLIYQGVRRAVDMHEPTLLVDIGGGSTEFVVCTSDEVFFQTSCKVGAARMAGAFVSTDPVDAAEFRALRAHYRDVLAPVFAAARRHGVREVVGSSGTMENLAQVCAETLGDDGRSIFLQPFEAEAFRKTTKRIMVSSREEREAMSGIDTKRVDQIVAGAALADLIVKDLGVERVRISPNALREGMVVHFIRENDRRLEWLAPYGDVRRRSVHEVGFRFQWDRQHAEHVTAMALQLFDACRPLHGLGNAERELLEYASLLHDIGYYISRTGHHKHSLYLIRQADWHGFQPEEIIVMANVARYHRRSLPKSKHTAYTRLPKDRRRLVDELGSFLRIANGLDRSHFQNVTHLRAQLTEEALEIELQTQGDPQLEMWGGRRGGDLFERTFGRGVRITSARPGRQIVDTSEPVKTKHLLT